MSRKLDSRHAFFLSFFSGFFLRTLPPRVNDDKLVESDANKKLMNERENENEREVTSIVMVIVCVCVYFSSKASDEKNEGEGDHHCWQHFLVEKPVCLTTTQASGRNQTKRKG